MSKYDILQYVKFAKEAIEEDNVKNYEKFVEWLHKNIDGLQYDPLPSSEAKLANRAWMEAWDEKVEDAKKGVRLRARSLMVYAYREYVMDQKTLTDEEFYNILLDFGLARVFDGCDTKIVDDVVKEN